MVMGPLKASIFQALMRLKSATGKPFLCLYKYLQTTQSITAEGHEESCPREEEAMFTMKETTGNASKQTGKTQYKVKLMINVT